MENGWIRWSQWSDAGMVNFGQMPWRDADKYLKDFEVKAREILDESGADRVVYGVKRYDEHGVLEEVRFYLQPMDDERFEKDTANISDVYAVHARK